MDEEFDFSLHLGFWTMVLQLIFIILKLTNSIDWSWLIVCIPLIVIASLIGLVIFINLACYIGEILIDITQKLIDKKRKNKKIKELNNER